eukprot:gnl/TRDRNA2_/TRDRNA2_169969_c0_seq12.p1 gnl/TRDRNA2_/TRDRNA2_169969_c0~~gnl/TRDRNA2_/TRDRNA2_169969_c0_seq12.p1  ORF type:complete len:178 (+),score=65.65 gnl/TRDRNA2_/TRDRNA2_169969_c0_seq12:40-573(+)
MRLLVLLFFVGAADAQTKVSSTCTDRLDQAPSTDETGFLQLDIHNAVKGSAEIQTQTAGDALWHRANMAEGASSAQYHHHHKHHKRHKHREEMEEEQEAQEEEQMEEENEEEQVEKDEFDKVEEHDDKQVEKDTVEKSLRKKFPFSLLSGLMMQKGNPAAKGPAKMIAGIAGGEGRI